MGRRGPPPKPTWMKRRAGNPGHRRINPREPSFPVPEKLPAPPDFLCREAKREWKQLGPILLERRVLTEADLSAFTVLCQACGRWQQAERELAKKGSLITTPNGHKVLSPYLIIANQGLKQMKLWLAEFGLTPTSRTRIIASPPSEDYEEKRKAEKHLGPQFIRPTPPR